MQPMLNIGPAALQTATLILLLGVFLGVQLSERSARRQAIAPGWIESAAFYATLAGIVAGRLTYAALHFEAYRRNPTSLISTFVQTIHGPAALLTAVAVFGLLAWRSRIAFRPLLDASAPGWGILAAALALGDWMDGINVGQITDMPWGIELWGEVRHPVQLYVAVPILVTVLGLFVLRVPRPFAGFDFLAVAGVYALAVMVSSAWRESSPTVFADINRTAAGAWATLLLITFTGWRWASGPERNESAATSP